MFNMFNMFNNNMNIKNCYQKIDYDKLPKFNRKFGEKLIDLKKIPKFINLKKDEKIIYLDKIPWG